MKCRIHTTILIILCLIFLAACQKNQDKEIESQDKSIRKFCAQYATDYEILEKKETTGDKFKISINAPDFNYIIKTLSNKNQKITLKNLKEIIEKHPDQQKKYIFYSSTSKSKDIENAFMEEISYDLATDAIKNVKYSDKWSTEE